MTPTITFRLCTISDVELLSKIALKSYPPHYAYLWEDGGDAYLQKYYTPAAIRADFEDPQASYYSVMLDDKTVGFIRIVGSMDWNGKPNDEMLELHRIYFVKEATGQGIGKKAMEFVLSKAEQLGKKNVWLKVMDSSPALAFYQKMGFQKCVAIRLNESLVIEKYRGMYVMEYEMKYFGKD